LLHTLLLTLLGPPQCQWESQLCMGEVIMRVAVRSTMWLGVGLCCGSSLSFCVNYGLHLCDVLLQQHPTVKFQIVLVFAVCRSNRSAFSVRWQLVQLLSV